MACLLHYQEGRAYRTLSLIILPTMLMVPEILLCKPERKIYSATLVSSIQKREKSIIPIFMDRFRTKHFFHLSGIGAKQPALNRKHHNFNRGIHRSLSSSEQHVKHFAKIQ
jgi:hypothetical protein